MSSDWIGRQVEVNYDGTLRRGVVVNTFSVNTAGTVDRLLVLFEDTSVEELCHPDYARKLN